MSLHKLQIFAIISLSLSIFGFLITQIGSTFGQICSQTLGNTSSTVVNGSAATTSVVTCGGIIDTNVTFLIALMAAVGAVCVLPFV